MKVYIKKSLYVVNDFEQAGILPSRKRADNPHAPGDNASGAVAPARLQNGQESHMKKSITFAAVTALAIGLAACSPKAKDESAEAANAMMSDMNATAADAINSVDAATDNAMGSIGNAADAAGNKVESAADKMKAATGAAMETAGNEVSEAGADVKK
jgi:hypothetical protein